MLFRSIKKTFCGFQRELRYSRALFALTTAALHYKLHSYHAPALSSAQFAVRLPIQRITRNFLTLLSLSSLPPVLVSLDFVDSRAGCNQHVALMRVEIKHTSQTGGAPRSFGVKVH